jgi:hypothetical protein
MQWPEAPAGVVALMTPWNGNPWFVRERLASARAAGCTVAMDSSELRSFPVEDPDAASIRLRRPRLFRGALIPQRGAVSH